PRRRAPVARLLACVLPVVALAAGGASAAAAPATPRVMTTDPPSSAGAPAGSLTPAILGEAEPEDGIILESVPFPARATSGLTSTVERPTENPGFEIEIFGGAGCLGTAIVSGSAEALESGGLAVQVTADSETIFSAKQVDPTDPSEPSGCSNALAYWEGNVAGPESGAGGSGGGTENGAPTQGTGDGRPSGSGTSSGSIGTATPAGGRPQAPQIHTEPGGRANDPTPFVVGSAPGAGSVTVYASSNCSGAPVAKGAPAQLSSGFQVLVALNAETTFSAVSVGAQRSACSAAVTYAEAPTAPLTRVTMGPGVKTRKHNAIFRFKDVTTDPPGTTCACKLDKTRWKQCASPFHAKHLKLGFHVVRIRATDLA